MFLAVVIVSGRRAGVMKGRNVTFKAKVFFFLGQFILRCVLNDKQTELII